MARSRLWTEQEIKQLRWNLGHKSFVSIGKLLARTPNAVKCKANELGIRASRATYSLSDLIRLTGYNWKQITQSRDKLKQRWGRINTRRGKYRVTYEQFEALVQYLGRPAPYLTLLGFEIDVWAPKWNLNECTNCGESGKEMRKRHYALGLCYTCWYRLKGHPQTNYLKKRQRILLQWWGLLDKLGISSSSPLHPYEQIDTWRRCTNLSIDTVHTTGHPDLFHLTVKSRERRS